jgi:hypothetical protein
MRTNTKISKYLKNTHLNQSLNHNTLSNQKIQSNNHLLKTISYKGIKQSNNANLKKMNNLIISNNSSLSYKDGLGGRVGITKKMISLSMNN